MKSTHLVSLAVPCRNEEKYIADFIDGISKQDYPSEKIEIVIADGMSNDRTREIIKKCQKKNPDPKIKLVNNPKKITPIGFNIAIKNSAGDFVLPIGAHSKLPSDYVSNCVKYLNKYSEASSVGGTIRTLPKSKTSTAKAIATSLSHPFGTGNARFRNKVSFPGWVDTVFGGCYRRAVFEDVGYYNEKLVRSQDLELNLRLIGSGGKILIVPELEIDYYPKGTFGEILKYHLKCGFWAIYAKNFTDINYKLRQYLSLIVFLVGLFLFVGSFFAKFLFLAFLSMIFIYLLMSLYFSLAVSLKEGTPFLVVKLPIAFFLRHFGFGLGSFVGLFALFFSRSNR